MTQSARAAALEWAATARAARFGLREKMRSGELQLADVLAATGNDPLLGQVKVLWTLESVPGASKVLTRRKLAELGLAESTRIGTLSADQRQVIVANFGALPGREAGGLRIDTGDGITQHGVWQHGTWQHGSGEMQGARSMSDETPDPVAGRMADAVADPAADKAGDQSVAAPIDGRIVVISGPGGVGKGTVVTELLKVDDRLWLSRSWTTRSRRPGEAADAYHFATPEEFEEHASRGGFLEHANFLDYRQGSPVPNPPAGKDVVFEIDVQGAGMIAELYPESLLVFIDAPSRQVQEARMRGRGDAEDRIAQRLRKAEEELERSKSLPFTYVINDDLSTTVDDVLSLIEAHRAG